MKRLLFAGAVCVLGTLSTSAWASDGNVFRQRAHDIATKLQVDFECEGKHCLKKAITYGGEGNNIPEQYRALMIEKLRLGPKSDKDGKAVAATLMAFIGACNWVPEECVGIVINSAHRYKSQLGSKRHRNKFATRAFDFQGFLNTKHQIRFLTRMALVVEELELKPNVGLGTAKKNASVHITHFDVNGNEISSKRSCKTRCKRIKKKGRKKKVRRCKTTCTWKKGSVTWKYSLRNTLQIRFQNQIRQNRISLSFLNEILSGPLDLSVNAVVTFYGPADNGSAVEGKLEAYAPNLEGEVNKRGNPTLRTMDDYRLGVHEYISLASAPENLRRFYALGAVTYRSPLDGKVYTGDKDFAKREFLYLYDEDDKGKIIKTIEIVFSAKLEKVFGYTHDIGGAFKAVSCKKSGSCSVRLRKFDIPVGDAGNIFNIDIEPCKKSRARCIEMFVDNPVTQWYGYKALHRWEQIRELPGSASIVEVSQEEEVGEDE
jgi:hypothetical protein